MADYLAGFYPDFVEQEEQITAQVACYVDEHLDHFVQVTGAPE